MARDAYLAAYEQRPTRLEPLYHLATHYRKAEDYSLGRLFAEPVRRTPYPDDVLFVEREWYCFYLPLEYAICCHWLGDYAEAIRVNNQLLWEPDLSLDLEARIIENRRFSLDALYGSRPGSGVDSHSIKVVVPFYNPGEFLESCVAILIAQDYPNFEVVFVDDASTDGSHLLVPEGDHRLTLIRNEQRLGVGWNTQAAVTEHCSTDDIVVLLDGDDWLAVGDALSHVNECYRRWGCWVLYGQFCQPDGRYGAAHPYADEGDFKRARSDPWMATHLKTFRAGLYHKIGEQDPEWAALKDRRGEWVRMAHDHAVMFPLMELAGFDRVCFNDRVIQVYNSENPLNLFRTYLEEQTRAATDIRARRPFAQVDDYR